MGSAFVPRKRDFHPTPYRLRWTRRSDTVGLGPEERSGQWRDTGTGEKSSTNGMSMSIPMSIACVAGKNKGIIPQGMCSTLLFDERDYTSPN